MKLSWVQSKKYTGWTKWIGRTPNGKPKCFYLGKDETEAELKAIRLTLAYKALGAAGKIAWTEDAIDAALTGSAPVPHTSSPAAPAAPPANPATTTEPQAINNVPMLHDAFAAYLKREEARAPGETSYAYLHGQRIRVKRLKAMMPNKPLAQVGYDDLARLVSYAASRPVSKTTKKRISVVTAVDTIKGARTIFDWLDISERWVAPRRFERIFRINRKSLLTPDERNRQNDGVETFTVEELVKIMKMAWTPWHRAFIRTALNLAMTQWELACLSREHLKGFDTSSPRIEKCREKTTIFCRWGYVFPEVVMDLQRLMRSHNHDLIFVGPNGLPPVRFHSEGRIDTVSCWWSRLVNRAEVRRIVAEIDTQHFRQITESTLEGLAKRELNLSAIVGKHAEAKERRLVPEVIEEFFCHAGPVVGVTPKEIKDGTHVYRIGRMPRPLWPLGEKLEPEFGRLAREYKNVAFDKEIVKRDATLDWVTPGHPLFETVRTAAEDAVREDLERGAVLYDLHASAPYHLDVFGVSIKDGRGSILHRRLFVVCFTADGQLSVRQPTIFLDLAVTPNTATPPSVTLVDRALREQKLVEEALSPFLDEVTSETAKQVKTIREHLQISLDELIHRQNMTLAKLHEDQSQFTEVPNWLLASIKQAEDRIDELNGRLERRMAELAQEEQCSIGAVEYVGSAWVLPHPERTAPGIAPMVRDEEIERIAVETVIAHETARGWVVESVEKDNRGFDLISRRLHPEDPKTALEVRFIEVKAARVWVRLLSRPGGGARRAAGVQRRRGQGLDHALEKLRAPLRETAPLSAGDQLKTFRVRDGYAADLVVSEPRVRQPLYLAFDERGRMWGVQYIQYPVPAGVRVVEYDQYLRAKFDRVPPAPPRHDRGNDVVSIFEDSDGDGTFETQKTFVEGLNIATAALPGRGGVWVLNPPYLLFYPDKDRDDVPDGDPVVHLSGFGLEDTHAVASSLMWGPDGWIYGA